MTVKQLPPIDLLRERLSYDPQTGVIVWSNPPKGCSNLVNREAGVTHWTGYRRITFNYLTYTAARLAWALYYGEDPYPYDIDHINRDQTDNRIVNLRKVTRQVNNQNRKPHLLAHTRKPVKITYPDGRGSIIVDSGNTAAKLLNIERSTVTAICKREDNQIYWGTNKHTRTATNIRLEFIEEYNIGG